MYVQTYILEEALVFEWDQAKASANLTKHGIDFEDAIEIFEAPVLEVRSDRFGEERYLAIGMTTGHVIAVVYTQRGGIYRIISARKASRHERKAYHQAYSLGKAEREDRLESC